MGGILLDQPLPVRGIDQIDPFLLVHHWKDKLAPNQDPFELGVGPHPHRGFAPVTFIFEGALHHRDSIGNSSIITRGGTQWMNSGKGIVHSERPPKELAKSGGDFEIIQFWVNAPKAHKMDHPNYQPLTAKETPKLFSEDKKITLGVVAGTIQDKIGKINTYSPLLILRPVMQKGGKMSFEIPKNYNAFWYQLDGETNVNGSIAKAKEMLWFNNDHNLIHLEVKASGRAILLAGQPIQEPVATYGPFVMNTEEEVMQAIRDYQGGKMGVLNEQNLD
jgi:redox-sensitive bicupin YhaK (pirin superfamily)